MSMYPPLARPRSLQTRDDALDGQLQAAPLTDREVRSEPMRRLPSAVLTSTEHSRVAYREQLACSYTPRSHKFESVDFRTPSSTLNAETLFSHTSQNEHVKNITAHGMVVCVGLVVGFLAFLIDQATSRLQWLIYTITQTTLDDQNLNPVFSGIVFTTLSGGSLAISAIFVVFGSPVAAGSGIPEMKSYLNGIRIPGLFKLRTLVVKVVALVFALGGGILSGKQGPLNHVGSIVGAAVSQGASGFFKFRIHSKLYRPFRTEESKRDFAAVGSAVGVSVAFGAPLGGTLWAMEEAVTHWSQPLTWITAVGCIVGSFTSGLLSNIVKGTGMSLGHDKPLGRFRSPIHSEARLADLVCFTCLGVLGGALGCLIPVVSSFISRWRYRYLASPQLKLVEAIFVGCFTAAARFVVSVLFGTCEDTPVPLEREVEETSFLDFSRFVCSGNQNGKAETASVWARLIYNPLIVSLRSLLHVSEPDIFPVQSLMGVIAIYLPFTMLTHGAAVPNGLFAPIMLIGAAYGRLAFFVSKRIFGREGDLVRLYAVVGAASALGGVTRLSVSTAILLVEATQANMVDSFPTIFAGVVAKLVGDAVTMSVFDVAIALKGLPFFTSRITEPHLYNRARVRDIMSDKVIAVRTKLSIGELVNILQTHKHNSFPVFQDTLSSQAPSHETDDARPSEASRTTRAGLAREFSQDRPVSPGPITVSSESASLDVVPRQQDQPIMLKVDSRPAMIAIVPRDSQSATKSWEDETFPSSHSLASRYVEGWDGKSNIGPKRDGVSTEEASESNSNHTAPNTRHEPDPSRWKSSSDSPQALDGLISRVDLIALVDHCIGRDAMDANWTFDSYELTRENFDSAWPRGEYVNLENEILSGVTPSLRKKTFVENDPTHSRSTLAFPPRTGHGLYEKLALWNTSGRAWID